MHPTPLQRSLSLITLVVALTLTTQVGRPDESEKRAAGFDDAGAPNGWHDGDRRAMTLQLAIGGEVRGPLLSFTDQVVVIEQDGFPYAVAYERMDSGSAYRTKKSALALQRHGPQRLLAADHFTLGLLALQYDRKGLAIREFDLAKQLDAAYQSRATDALAAYDQPEHSTWPLTGHGPAQPDPPSLVESNEKQEKWTTMDESSQAKVTAGYKEVGIRIREEFGKKLVLVESPHFLIWTDWPAAEHKLLQSWVERMYAELARHFNLSPQDNIFAGKCPIYCMGSRGTFRTIARLLDGYQARDALGYTSKDANGHVHVVVYRFARSPAALRSFAGTLIHEGTHAFLHRHRGPHALPAWIEEGLANVVAEAVLQDRCSYDQAADAVAREIVRGPYDVSPILAQAGPLDARYYSAAHSLVSHLIQRDRSAFSHLVDDIKSGTTTTDALQRRYQLTPKTLDNEWRSAHRGR